MARRRNRKLLYFVIIVILVVVGVVTFLICKNIAQKNENEGGGTEVTQEDNKKEETKNPSDNKIEDDDENIPEKQVPKYDGGDPNKAEDLSGVITYAEVIGDKFMVGVNIDQFLASGSCNLSLIQGGNTVYNANAEIMADVATSYCDGFMVPVGEIGSGEYEVVVEISSGDKTGTIRGKGNV